MPILNMIAQGSGGGGGGNIGEPLNLTVTTSGLDATITWEDNEIGTIPPTTFQKSELVRKIGSAPTSPSDGTLVVTETVKDTYKTTGYVDQGLTDGETYYYRVFSYSDLGGISYCDAVSVTPRTQWQPGVNTKFYYNINDNDTNSIIYDLSGNGVNQTWYGTPGYTTDATYGRVATFDGSSYTQAGSIVNLGGECTFIALVNASVGGAIVVECTAPSAYGIGLSYNRDNGTFSGWYSGVLDGTARVDSLSTAPLNQWVMVASTRASDGTAKIYVNGVLDNTTSGMRNPDYSSGANLQLGRWRSGDAKYLNGQIKLIIGENRTWTDQEIAGLAREYGF